MLVLHRTQQPSQFRNCCISRESRSAKEKEKGVVRVMLARKSE